jgi:ribosome-associated toxin RatA of RatAB toxin-antitoxin module
LRSRIEIAIDAPSRRVFELARDVAAWPTLLPHYRRVTVLSRDDRETVADMRAVRTLWGRAGIRVGWRARFWSDEGVEDDLQLRFVHVGGPTKGMDVTWHITPGERGGSTATIEHDFQRRLPLMGDDVLPRLVDRLFVRPIAERTLATFKRLAEQEA